MFLTHRDYYDGYLQIYKNGSAVTELKSIIRNAGHIGETFTSASTVGLWYAPPWPYAWTQSAGGTSALAYSVYVWTQNSSQPIYYNTSANNSFQPTSTMILTEIAG